MALDKQRITFPLFLGRDGGSDPKAVRDNLLEAKNVWHDKEGSLSKRPGLWKGTEVAFTASEYLDGLYRGKLPPLLAADTRNAYIQGGAADPYTTTKDALIPSPAVTFGNIPNASKFRGKRMSTALGLGSFLGITWGVAPDSSIADIDVSIKGITAAGAAQHIQEETWDITEGKVLSSNDTANSGTVAYTSEAAWSVYQDTVTRTDVDGTITSYTVNSDIVAHDVIKISSRELSITLDDAGELYVKQYIGGTASNSLTYTHSTSLFPLLGVFLVDIYTPVIVLQEDSGDNEILTIDVNYSGNPLDSLGTATSRTSGTSLGRVRAISRFPSPLTGHYGGFVAIATGTTLDDLVRIETSDASTYYVGSINQVPAGADFACNCWRVTNEPYYYTFLRLGESVVASLGEAEATLYYTWALLRVPTRNYDVSGGQNYVVHDTIFPREAPLRASDVSWVPLSDPFEDASGDYVIPLPIGGALLSTGYVNVTTSPDLKGRVPTVKYDNGYICAIPGVQSALSGKLLHHPAGAPTPVLSATTGASLTGDYQYVLVPVHQAGDGRLVFGRPSTPRTITASGTAIRVRTYSSLLTHSEQKAINIYRTKAGAEPGSAVYYYIATIESPDITTVDYTDTTVDDDLSDEAVIYYQQDAVTHDTPPSARDIWLHDSRLFLIPAGDATQIWYSRRRKVDINNLAGEGPSFAPQCTIDVGPAGELLRGTSFGGTCLLFAVGGTYIIGGDGPNAANIGDFSTPQQLAVPNLSDENSLVNTGEFIMYKTTDTWILLDRGFNATRVGTPVEDLHSSSILSAVQRKESVLQFLLEDGVTSLVFDTELRQWYRWEYELDGDTLDRAVRVDGGEGTVAQSGNQLYGEPAVKFRDIDTDDEEGEYTMLIETRWFNLDVFAGFERLYELAILGQYKSPHTIKVTIYYDYDETVSESTTKAFSADPGTYMVSWQPKRQVNRAFKIRIEEQSPSGSEESFSLTGMDAIIGVKPRTHFASTESLG